LEVIKSWNWNEFLQVCLDHPQKSVKIFWDPIYGKYIRPMAGSWVTCAVGNQCNIIPRTPEGVPRDIELYRLGINFYDSIYSMDRIAERIEHYNTPCAELDNLYKEF